jgi:phage replication-related protein YjqB (UPF0714/DUF867 family)
MTDKETPDVMTIDKYHSFSELAQHEKKDEDYTLFYREIDSDIAVIAIHGGGIEPGTIDIADVIAGCDYTFYAFKGIKKTGNQTLHISSNRFDEAMGLRASKNALITLSIHGSKDRTKAVHIGGRHQKLKEKIMDALQTSGFNAVISDVPGLRGIKPENICNRCKCGEGIQLEISRGLREKMFENLDHRVLRKKTALFYQFVNTLKKALLTTHPV